MASPWCARPPSRLFLLPTADRSELFRSSQQLTFARTESDALVQKRHPDDMEAHKKARLKRKSALLVSFAGQRAAELTLFGAQSNRDETTLRGGRSWRRRRRRSRVRPVLSLVPQPPLRLVLPQPPRLVPLPLLLRPLSVALFRCRTSTSRRTRFSLFRTCRTTRRRRVSRRSSGRAFAPTS